MNGLSAELRKTISIAAAIIGAAACVICLIFVNDKLPMALAVICGTCVSILNFNIMAIAGEKAINASAETARRKMTMSYMLRYAIYFVFLVIAVKVSFLNPIGMIIGFLTTMLALYLTQVLNTPGNRDKLKKLLRRAK